MKKMIIDAGISFIISFLWIIIVTILCQFTTSDIVQCIATVFWFALCAFIKRKIGDKNE